MPLPGLVSGSAPRRRFRLMQGLQRRIMMYVALGSLCALLLFSYVAHRALDESTQVIFHERLHLAGLVAAEVEERLQVGPDGTLVLRDPEPVKQLLAVHAASFGINAPDYHLALTARDGTVLIASGTLLARFSEPHKQLLAAYLPQNQPVVVLHEPPAPAPPHLVAYTPLPHLPGGIILEESRDVALAIPRTLLSRMGILATLFLTVGLFLAWATTRQVVGPLTRLTAITRRIAGGDLSTPVPGEGQDEVQDLASSFEAMRRQLQESHAQLAQANSDLEGRVQERTAELELRHAELAEASRLLQEREAERSFLLDKTIQAQEEERRRVARDLHDGVGQLLSTLVVRLSVLENQARGLDTGLPEQLAEVRDLAGRTVGEVRRLIVDLRPELLDDMGLVAAVGWYAEQMLSKQGMGVYLDVDAVDNSLPAQMDMVVFRVLQEAINNVVKHSGARNAHIGLRCKDNQLVGSVGDDGRGFQSPRRGAAGGGVGLIGMRERIALLGGSLDIRSSPGQGTTLSFRLPLKKGESA